MFSTHIEIIDVPHFFSELGTDTFDYSFPHFNTIIGRKGPFNTVLVFTVTSQECMILKF